MGELLLINPRRRKARKTASKKRVRRASTARRANPAPRRRRAVAHRRRRNPTSLVGRHVTKRRAYSRRRRNPIAIPNMNGFMAMFKEAAIGGAGAIAMDALWGQINDKLPASMQRTAGQPGVGDAVKAVTTVLIGTFLNKATKGLSKKAATGALTVQAAEVMAGFLPTSVQLGYITPATRLMRGNSRLGPNGGRMGQFAPNMASPVLGLRQPGSPMLNGVSARQREGVTVR